MLILISLFLVNVKSRHCINSFKQVNLIIKCIKKKFFKKQEITLLFDTISLKVFCSWIYQRPIKTQLLKQILAAICSNSKILFIYSIFNFLLAFFLFCPTVFVFVYLTVFFHCISILGPVLLIHQIFIRNQSMQLMYITILLFYHVLIVYKKLSLFGIANFFIFLYDIIF